MLQSVDFISSPSAGIGFDADAHLASSREGSTTTTTIILLSILILLIIIIPKRFLYLAGLNATSCLHFLCGVALWNSAACCTISPASNTPNPYLQQVGGMLCQCVRNSITCKKKTCIHALVRKVQLRLFISNWNRCFCQSITKQKGLGFFLPFY